jgi:hypothetical protein
MPDFIDYAWQCNCRGDCKTMKKLIILLASLFFAQTAWSQYGNTITTWGSGAPAGTCISVVQRYVDTANGNVYSCDVATHAWKLSAPASAISGTGTTNKIAKFTAAGTIGNSQITDTGSSVKIPSNTTILGNYTLNWKDNTDTTTYAYIQGNTSNFILSAVNVPFQIQCGTLGASICASLTSVGDWVFNYAATDSDFSIYKQTAGVAYSYTAGTDTHLFNGAFTLGTPLTSTYGGLGASLAAAGAGTYPKSSGGTPAVYAASTLAASGTGACTNQFVRTLNGDAAPTCASVTGTDIASGYALLASQTTTLTAAKLKAFNGVLNLTQATDSGDNVVYTGTITNGGVDGDNPSGGLSASYYTIAGFVEGGNNGSFYCASSTTTTLTCANAGAVNETHAGTATNLGFKVVDAPGANLVLAAVSWTLQYRYNTTAFTLGNPDNSLISDYGTVTAESTNEAYFGVAGLVDQVVNMVGTGAFYSYPLAQTSVSNTPIRLSLVGTTPALTLGDGSVVVTVRYHAVPML